MTKKERAEFDAAIERAELLAALRWTEEVKPDVLPPQDARTLSGWTFNSYTAMDRFSGRAMIWEAWTESNSHGSGKCRPKGGGGSKGGLHLHSTPRRALRALRHQLELRFAEVLRRVDKAIADELAKSMNQDASKESV